ncbi:MAG: nucleotidyl transferase AbiEii/AbiGii toxin family protein [Candidatus Micrarchaeales archaeon]|nr:nucleotidyl transferase AbiEii/AbiGii toxin family protein [Candidatus Micrarchaeales archaeon]
MIEKDELLKIGIYEQPYQKEKDYVEELFLDEIYTITGELVFKGGTALSKFYNSIRFSDDLDFSLAHGDGGNKLPVLLDDVIDKISKEYPLKIMRKKNNADMLVYELSVRGPLFEMLNKYQHLKIEVDKKASVIEKTEVFRRNPIYPDLKPYVAVVMSRKEILSEKIVALLFRHNAKARDLYDIYFLVKGGVDFEVSMIDKKMKEYGHTFAKDRLLARMKQLGLIWNKELERLLSESEFVKYKDVKEYLMTRFGAAGLI